MNRRQFLTAGMGGILLAAAAPAIVRADSLMRIIPRETTVIGIDMASSESFTGWHYAAWLDANNHCQGYIHGEWEGSTGEVVERALPGYLFKRSRNRVTYEELREGTT